MSIPQPAEKSRQAGTLYQSSVDISNKNCSPTIIYDAIPQGSLVLDVGCACGDLGIILAQNKACTVYGMEYNEKSVQIALETQCYQQVWACNLETLDIQEFAAFFNFFDYIVFADILEHLQYPSLAVKKLLALLKPDGKCLISLPNVSHGSIKAQILDNNFQYTPVGTLDETHLRFFTHKTIPPFLAQNHLLVSDVRCTSGSLNGFYDCAIYDNIDNHIFRRIAEDIHSYVIQYVILASRDDTLPQEDLRKANAKQLALEGYHDVHIARFKREYRRKQGLTPLHIFKLPAQIVYLFARRKKKYLFTRYDNRSIYDEMADVMKGWNRIMRKMVLYSLNVWGKLIRVVKI